MDLLLFGHITAGPDHLAFNTLILVATGLFGLCCGSFYNVCIYRLPREGMTIGRPLYSFCPHCFTTLSWYENIPLLSYFFQGGQCRHCFVFISPRYPMVEALTAALFMLVASHFAAIYPHPPQWGVFAVYLALVSALIVCSFIDLDLRIIPDEIDKPGMWLAPLVSLLVPSLHQADLKYFVLPFGQDTILHSLQAKAVMASVAGIIAGAGIIFVIGLMGKALFQKEAMGFGDVKFMGMIGGFIGFKSVLVAFLLACFAGAIIGLLVKVITRDSYIPFGPFLALGSLGMMFYRPEIIDLVFTRYPLWLRRLML